MAASTFNPLEAARTLEAAGVERRQAEAHAEALRQAATADRDELATKADLAALKADLAALEARMTANSTAPSGSRAGPSSPSSPHFGS